MKVTQNLILLSAAFAALITSCNPANDIAQNIAYPAKAVVSEYKAIYTNSNAVNVYHGGFGSAMAAVPGQPGYFYLMTDRGPNVDGADKDSKIFPLPNFTPKIGKFKLEGDALVLKELIELKNAAGQNITGRPNPIGAGNAGETAKDINGNVIDNDPDGLDSEGLAIGADGSLWVSDEYGPHIAHFDKTGKQIERLNPFVTGKNHLPNVFKKRRANRGMEGLAITPDGKTLVGIMQSPMYNPSKSAVSASKVTRILTYNIATGATQQFVYVLESTATANSEITAITDSTFLVLERDGEFPNAGTSIIKRIYKININKATDVSDAADSDAGKLYGGKTVDQLTDAELAANNITPVSKTLVVDIATDVPNYPHDKPEGIAIINNTMIAIVNDDDFGINTPDVKNNNYIAKILPLTQKTDQGNVYFIKLKQPLK